MQNVDYNVRATNAVKSTNQVGTIQKTFGANGQLVVKTWDNFPENITEPLWVEIDSLAVPLFVNDITPQGTAKAVITFDDFQTEHLAQMLAGLKIYAENTDPNTTDEQYNQLVGYTVTDQTTKTKAKVIGVIESQHNPLLEVMVAGQHETVLLPIADELIVKIDPKKQTIVLNLPEGIFDLN